MGEEMKEEIYNKENVVDFKCRHKKYKKKRLPNGNVIDICEHCGMSRLKDDDGGTSWFNVDVELMVKSIEEAAIEEDVDYHYVLQRLLQDGYIKTMTTACKAIHYKYNPSINKPVVMEENVSVDFRLSKAEMLRIEKEKDYFPDLAEDAFNKVAERIDAVLHSYEEANIGNKNVYIMFGLIPSKNLFGDLVTSISDPSTGIVISLDGVKEENSESRMLWTLRTTFGIIYGKERKSPNVPKKE